MKEGAAQKPVYSGKDLIAEKAAQRKAAPNMRAEHVDEMRRKVSGLGSLKMSAPPQTDIGSFDDDEPVMVLSPASIVQGIGRDSKYWMLYAGAGLITLGWLAFCATYAFIHPETFTLAPGELGMFLGGVFAPPALIWLVASSLNRRADVEHYSIALRSELHKLLFPDNASEHLINQDVQRMVEQAAEISAASRAVLKSLQRARQGLRMEVRDYAGVSKKTEFHIDRLAETLHERSAKLLSLTNEIEQRTSYIEAKTQAGTEAWDNATLKILERAGQMEAAMGKGADDILTAADRADEKVRDLESHMTRSYDNLNSAVDNVATRLSGLSTRFDGQVEGLNEVERRLSEKTDTLGNIIKTKVGDLRTITDDALQAMTRSSEMIKEQKESFDRSARVFADQSRQIGTIVSGSVEGLNEAVESVIAKGISLEEKLGSRTQDIRSCVSTLSKESENLDRIGNSISSKLDEAVAVATAGSEAVHASVRRAADLIETKVKDSTKNVSQFGEEIDTLVGRTEGRLKDMENVLEARAGSIRNNADIAARALAETKAAIEDASTSLNHTNVTLQDSRNTAQSISDSTVDKIKQIGVVFDDRLAKLKEGTQGALHDLNTINNELARSKDNVNNAAGDAYEKIRSLGIALDDRRSDLHKLADQLTAKVNTVQDAVQEQFQDLTASVGLAVAMIGESGNEFVKQAKTAEQAAERAATGFERVGFVAREESELLNKSAELVTQRATRQAAALRDELKSLLDNSGVLGDIKQAGEAMSQRAAEFAQKMQEALQASQSFNTELKLQAMHAASASRDSVETLERAVSSLSEKTEEIGRAAMIASEKIHRTQNDLKTESERLISVSSAALESARNATLNFGKQSDALFKAVQDSATRIEEIKGLEGRARRETFMDTAKFLFEKLHSLSIDLTRTIEGEISEKDWKSYQAGDLSVFTNRLAGLKNEVPMDQARAQFIKNAEFRAYVQRFIRQFEELYLQAGECDHNSVLGTTLASSDIGKVYVFLCAVAGAKTRFSDSALKAA